MNFMLSVKRRSKVDWLISSRIEDRMSGLSWQSEGFFRKCQLGAGVEEARDGGWCCRLLSYYYRMLTGREGFFWG